MGELKNYLNNEIQTKIVIERSKFLSFSFICESVSRQEEILRNMRKKHPSATHVCSASIIDDNGLKFYASDDGEPSGTAGLPILNALKEFNLINTMVVVVRYFGGVKLGASNLGKAYRDCATLSLENNYHKVVYKTLFNAQSDYSNFDGIKNICSKNKIEIFDEKYDSIVTFNMFLSQDEEILFEKRNIKLLKTNESKYC